MGEKIIETSPKKTNYNYSKVELEKNGQLVAYEPEEVGENIKENKRTSSSTVSR